MLIKNRSLKYKSNKMPYQQNVRVRVEKYVFAFHIILCLDTVSLPSYRLSHQQLPLSIFGMWPHLKV